MVIGARLCRELIEIVIKKKGGGGRNPGLYSVRLSRYIYIFVNYREEDRSEILFEIMGHSLNGLILEVKTNRKMLVYSSSYERLKIALDEARWKQHGTPRCGV